MINDILSYCHSQTYVEDQDGVFLAQCHNESLVGLLTTILSQDAEHCLTPAGHNSQEGEALFGRNVLVKSTTSC